MKPKLIFTQYETTTSWLERFPSIYNWAYQEYHKKHCNMIDVYGMITGAQKLLVFHAKAYWEKYIKGGICPKLPVHLGGLGYRGPAPTNKLTKLHLRNLSFLYKYNKVLFFLYQKRFNKLREVTVTNIPKNDYNFIHRFQGIYPMERFQVKDTLNRVFSWRDILLSGPKSSENRDLNELLSGISHYVNMVYKTIKYEFNIQGSYKPPLYMQLILRPGTGLITHIEEYYLTYIKEEQEYYRLVKSKLKLKEITIDLGQPVTSEQPYYVGRGEQVNKWFDLKDIGVISHIPSKPIKDPRFVYLNKEGVKIINKLSHIPKEIQDQLDIGRVTREMILGLAEKLTDKAPIKELELLIENLLVERATNDFIKPMIGGPFRN
jgi:hypothetical protein